MGRRAYGGLHCLSDRGDGRRTGGSRLRHVAKHLGVNRGIALSAFIGGRVVDFYGAGATSYGAAALAIGALLASVAMMVGCRGFVR